MRVSNDDRPPKHPWQFFGYIDAWLLGCQAGRRRWPFAGASSISSGRSPSCPASMSLDVPMSSFSLSCLFLRSSATSALEPYEGTFFTPDQRFLVERGAAGRVLNLVLHPAGRSSLLDWLGLRIGVAQQSCRSSCSV